MSKREKRHRRRYRRRKNGNWFTRLKTWQKILLCFVCVFVCTIVSTGLYVMAKWNKIDTQKIDADDLIINQEVQAQQNEDVDLGDGYTNIALFGVDSRDGNLGKGNRTDCIIIASLNNETKEIRMASVYRDTLLDLSEGTYQKCNAAYSFGGPVMAINMLNKNLDLDIQDYITVDFGAISDAIDLLGGIELDVTDEEAGYLNQYLQETADSAHKEAHFLNGGGHLLLDGAQATTFARIRSTAGGDFTRAERQRIVVTKMFEKARTADLKTINSIIDAVFPQVSTSFTLQEILKYASAYSQYTLGETMGFPVDKSTDTLSGLGSIVIPQDLTSNVAKLHDFLFGTAGYTPSSTVQQINGNIAAKVNGGRSDSSSDEKEEYKEDDESTEATEEDRDSGSSRKHTSGGTGNSGSSTGTVSGSGSSAGTGSGAAATESGGSASGGASGSSGEESSGSSGGSSDSGSAENSGNSSGGTSEGSGESGGSSESSGGEESGSSAGQ